MWVGGWGETRRSKAKGNWAEGGGGDPRRSVRGEAEGG